MMRATRGKMLSRGVMFSLLVSASLAAGLIPQKASLAQAAPEQMNPALKAGKSLVEALNQTADARLVFVKGAFTARALQNEAPEVRAAAFNALAEASGGFDIVSATPQGEQMVEIVAKARKVNRFGRFVVFTSKQEPGKITQLFVLSARDPAAAARDAWPKERVPTAQIGKEIHKRAQALADEDIFSGAVLVAQGDKVLFEKAYGFADLAWRQPNRIDTTFQIASIGKMFTSVAVLKLSEQGKLSLDDPLAKWVPEYPHKEAAVKITLRHLLTHTGGIAQWEGRRNSPLTGREAAATMSAAPSSAPGERFSYSNAGYVLLQAVVEAATKMSFEAALQDLVWKPAGLTRTGLWPVTAIVPNQATGYLRPRTDPLGFGPRYANDQYLGYAGDGSGGAYSTVGDLFRFHRALYENRLLSPRLTMEALSGHTDFPGTPRPSKYGYGVRLTQCGDKPVFGHSGGGLNSGVSNATFATTDGRWTVIVLANYDPAGEDLATSICDFLSTQ